MSARYWALLRAEPLGSADVVDVGTGSGRLAFALAPHCHRVLGIDRDAAALGDARQRALDDAVGNVEFAQVDAEARAHYVDLTPTWKRPSLVVAHLCMSEAIIAAAAATLVTGQPLAFVALHADQWRETGRRSRFAYDVDEARRQLEHHGFAVEHLEVEADVQRFATVEAGLAAAIGLAEKWKSDGRWFHYIKFLENGGRTLTRSQLVGKARRR